MHGRDGAADVLHGFVIVVLDEAASAAPLARAARAVLAVALRLDGRRATGHD